jgi:hypothetical protein
MLDLKRILLCVGFAGLTTNANAVFTAQDCETECTQATCQYPYKLSRCKRECSNFNAEDVCGIAKAAAPNAVSAKPTPSTTAAASTPNPARPSSQTATPRRSLPTPPTQAAVPKTEARKSTPSVPPSSGTQQINPDSQKFFKQFGSDLTSALNIGKCIYKSIAVDQKTFEKNKLSSLKSKLTHDKSKFTNHVEYQSRLSESYDSILFVDLNSFLSEFNNNWAKAGMIVYDSQMKGMITRFIRIGSQIAQKIPSYNSLEGKSIAADMTSPYLTALPNNVLLDLETCIKKNTFSTPVVNKSKDDFLNAITAELAGRAKDNLSKRR